MGKKELYINHKLIDKFAEEMAKGLVNRSKEPAVDIWPQPIFNPLIGNYYAHRYVISDLYNIFDELIRKRKFEISQIANIFRYPSRTAHLMYLLMEDSSDEEESEVRSYVCSRLLEVIDILRNKNPFCADGLNIVWNDNEIQEILKKYHVTKLDDTPQAPLTKNLISKLIIGFSGYCEFLYFANLAFGREFHGPYVTRYGKLVIREFFDLQPDFWNFADKFLWKKILFVTIYPENINIGFDFAGRLKSDKVLGPNLKHVSIVIDGKEIPIENSELSNLLRQTTDFLKKITQEVKDLNKVELMRKWIEAYFWILKPFKDILNRDWHPPEEIYFKINSEGPDTWLISVMKFLASRPIDIRFEIMKKIFDPRIVNKKEKILTILGEAR